MRDGSGHVGDGASGRAEFRRALVARLLVLRERGPVPTAVVREAARGRVSERTVWSWLRAGAYAPRPRSGYRLSDEARGLFFALRGNVAAVHRELASRDAGAPSRRTLERAIARELSPGERAYAARGAAGWREHVVYLRHEAPHRAAVYEADHKELAIEVLAPRAVRPRRPWATIFLDRYSRPIVGWALSLRPTAAEVLAALRMAVTADPARGFGGVPAALRWDRGLEFAARRDAGRRQLNRLDVATAQVLHRVVCGPRQDRRWNAYTDDERPHPAQLISLELVHDNGGQLQLSTELMANLGLRPLKSR
jgi:Integrase core domain